MIRLINDDCLKALQELPENSIDTCITDPPYGLGFMGKEWDTFDKSQFGIAGNEGDNDLKVKKNFKILPRYNNEGLYDFTFEWAQAVYRVLKPGGLLLSFGGTRTYHRIVCAIEDAGFEIRDCVMWVYSTGFPKSLNISKAIDKKPKADKVKEFKKWLAIQIDKCPKTKSQIDEECGFTACSYTKTDGKDYWSTNLPKNGKWDIMKRVIGITSTEYDWVAEDNVGERGYVLPTGGLAGGSGNTVGNFTGKQLSDKPISPEAQLWNGWGTQLKPAYEPIVIAQKPLDGTYAENALKWGVAGYWIDGGRVELAGEWDKSTMGTFRHAYDDPNKTYDGTNGTVKFGGKNLRASREKAELGRFPANFIHDGSDEVVSGFPNDAQRFFYCAKASRSERNAGLEGMPERIGGGMKGTEDQTLLTGSGNIRNNKMQNHHPTVKPLELMRYLVRLTKTPTGGVVLDPFMGSGTTGCACVLEGRDFIGIEKEPEYIEIAQKRIEYYQAPLEKFANGNENYK